MCFHILIISIIPILFNVDNNLKCSHDEIGIVLSSLLFSFRYRFPVEHHVPIKAPNVVAVVAIDLECRLIDRFDYWTNYGAGTGTYFMQQRLQPSYSKNNGLFHADECTSNIDNYRNE